MSASNNLTEKGGGFLLSIIGIAILAILLMFGGSIIDLGKTVTSNFDKMSSETTAALYSRFEDGSTHNGTAVISEIDSSEIANPNKLDISVRTLENIKSTTEQSYGYSSESDDSYTGYAVTDPESDNFIKPYGVFRVNQHTNNGVLTGYTFIQEQ